MQINLWYKAYLNLKSPQSFGTKEFFEVLKLKNYNIEMVIEYFNEKYSLLGEVFASNGFIEEQISKAKDWGIEILCYTSPQYPQMLRQINNPPLILFAKGNLQLLEKNKIAIVGSRVVSIANLKNVDFFAKGLCNKGYCVVSGFARGVDTQACKSAMGFGTIQVVATGLDSIYPEENTKLFDEVLANGGLFLSEYQIGANCSKWINVKKGEGVNRANFTNFPERNRIIAGISQAVIVAQANIKNEEQLDKNGIDFLVGSKSGSLNTAYHTLTQGGGRKLFAITGSPTDPSALGCNTLVSKKLATPIFTPSDVG